jgi:hypothetical protein
LANPGKAGSAQKMRSQDNQKSRSSIWDAPAGHAKLAKCWWASDIDILTSRATRKDCSAPDSISIIFIAKEAQLENS